METEEIMSDEQEVMGLGPFCFHCECQILDKKFSSLLVRNGFVVLHDRCFLEILDKHKFT